MMDRLNFRRRLMMESQKDRIIDLSLRDVYGNPIKRSTANCYVVKEPGQYKFPLVYGNAILNGEVNTETFTNNGSEYSHDFVDGMGSIITNPIINNRWYPVGINTDDESDVCDFDKDILQSGEDGLEFICINVKSVPINGANIIIGITDANDDHIVWSWHIWLWPHDLTPVKITNADGLGYNIMPVNLASKYDEDGVHIKNWFYQWGRPNPMLLPSAYNSDTDHTPGKISITSIASDLAEGLDRPYTFYGNNTSSGNWFGSKSYYNLWDASCTKAGDYHWEPVKTVYDPCPVGWKIPNRDVFTGFSDLDVVGSFSNGWYFKRYAEDTTGVFFPASGKRRSTYGSLEDVGSYGYVWCSASNSQKLAIFFNLGFSVVTANGTASRSTGMSVRPVEDDRVDIGVIMINFTIPALDKSYQAEYSMDWSQWVNSKYNVDGWYIDSNGLIVDSNGLICILGPDNLTENPTDLIVNGLSYGIEIV